MYRPHVLASHVSGGNIIYAIYIYIYRPYISSACIGTTYGNSYLVSAWEQCGNERFIRDGPETDRGGGSGEQTVERIFAVLEQKRLFLFSYKTEQKKVFLFF